MNLDNWVFMISSSSQVFVILLQENNIRNNFLAKSIQMVIKNTYL